MKKGLLVLAGFMMLMGSGHAQCTLTGSVQIGNPTNCGAINGYITLPGLNGTVSLYTVTYKRNNILITAEISGVENGLSIIHLGKGSYTDISISYNNGACTSFLPGPYILTDGSPIISVSPASDTICPGRTVILNAAGGNLYSWYPSTGLNTATGNVVMATPAQTTTYLVIGSTGPCSNTASVTITVTNDLGVSPVADRIACNGSVVSSIPFSGSAGAGFRWVNSNRAIGLDSAGRGDIPSFQAINTGNTPVTGIITVTPENIYNGYAYIPRALANDVIIYNTQTGFIAGALNVGAGPTAVAVSPLGDKVYIGNKNGNSVSVITKATNTVTATIAVGHSPSGLAVSPDGTRLYAANQEDNSVSVINTLTNSISATVIVGSAPGGIAVSPDGSKIYVANAESNSISVIDAATNLVINTISVGPSPMGLAFSPDGTTVYVANNGSNTVSVIDTASHSVTATITVGDHPFSIAVSPDGSQVYVSNTLSNTVSVIEAAARSVMASLPSGPSPQGISIRQDGTEIWVVTATGFTIINLTTNTGAGITLAGNPSALGNFIDGTRCAGPSKAFSITVNPSPSASISYPGEPFCKSAGNVVVNLSGTAGGSFSSSAGLSLNYTSGTIDLNLSQAGVYTVTYTLAASGGCPEYNTTTRVTINGIPPAPVITRTGNMLQSSAPTGNQWYLNGTAIAGATAQTFTPTQSGNYTVHATVNGCEGEMSAVFNYILTAIDSVVLENAFYIAPNPVQSLLQIRHKGPNGRYRFYLRDACGRTVFPNTEFKLEYDLDMSRFANGIYILELIDLRSGGSFRKKIFKSN